MKAFNTEIFTQFDKTWGLLCSGTMEHHNAMSISWGGMGTLWNKPVVTVYVNPLRYTYQFMETNEFFTVSFLPAELKKAHGVMGAKSGRDTDKDKEAHLKMTRELHRSFLEKCGEYGIAPAFENMPGPEQENRFGRTAGDLMLLCDALKEYHAGVCWDFGHGNLSFGDQTVEIEKLTGRILCVHVHDNRGKNDDHLMPFMGSIPWEKVLPAMRRTGFSNDLVLEVGQNGNMPDELKDESCLLCAHASRILIRLFEEQQ